MKIYSNFNKYLLPLLNSVIPVFLGGLIYIAFRTKTLIMFQWFNLFNLSAAVLVTRNFTETRATYIPTWIIYSLPSALWMYSFTFSLTYIWLKSASSLKFLWILLPLFLGLGSELSQYLGWVPGSFDILDLLLYIFASFLAINVTIILKNNKGEVIK